MRKKLLLARKGVVCLLSILLTLPVLAQNRVVSGKVTDSTGAPVAGASVVPLGSATGTATDANGVFHIPVGRDVNTLIISSVGFATRRVPITRLDLQISLVGTSTIQNEVIVIGYGSIQKKDLTGSISSIGVKDFQKGAITSPDQLIAGKVAGVQVTSHGGAPGASSTIRIRGISSLNSNNAPLIVIDGVVLPSTTQPNTTSGTSDPNSSIAGVASPLDLLNPDDIENVTILKDASAAAIYGSRASADRRAEGALRHRRRSRLDESPAVMDAAIRW